jgi:hypothetical protein
LKTTISKRRKKHKKKSAYMQLKCSIAKESQVSFTGLATTYT